jgi:hypothetical protein
METLPITAERKAQLEEYAQSHNQTPAEALDVFRLPACNGTVTIMNKRFVRKRTRMNF